MHPPSDPEPEVDDQPQKENPVKGKKKGTRFQFDIGRLIYVFLYSNSGVKHARNEEEEG